MKPLWILLTSTISTFCVQTCVRVCLRSRVIDRPLCCNHQSVIGIEQLIHVTGGVLQAIATVYSNEMQVDALGWNVCYGIDHHNRKQNLFKAQFYK